MCHKDYAAITEKSVQDIGDIAIMRPLAFHSYTAQTP